jgi:GTP-binding protein
MFGLPDPIDPDAKLGYVVDLPGYGYAAVAHAARLEWADVMGDYLATRPSLAGVVLLIDIRRGVTELDRRLADWLAPSRRPVLVLLTKADKLPYGQRIKAVFAVKKQLEDLGNLQAIPFSATARLGLDEATARITNWISPQVVP